MSVLMMPDAGPQSGRLRPPGRTRPDDERIALVDRELGDASSPVPAGQAVCRAVLLLHGWEGRGRRPAPRHSRVTGIVIIPFSGGSGSAAKQAEQADVVWGAGASVDWWVEHARSCDQVGVRFGPGKQ